MKFSSAIIEQKADNFVADYSRLLEAKTRELESRVTEELSLGQVYMLMAVLQKRQQGHPKGYSGKEVEVLIRRLVSSKLVREKFISLFHVERLLQEKIDATIFDVTEFEREDPQTSRYGVTKLREIEEHLKRCRKITEKQYQIFDHQEVTSFIDLLISSSQEERQAIFPLETISGAVQFSEHTHRLENLRNGLQILQKLQTAALMQIEEVMEYTRGEFKQQFLEDKNVKSRALFQTQEDIQSYLNIKYEKYEKRYESKIQLFHEELLKVKKLASTIVSVVTPKFNPKQKQSVEIFGASLAKLIQAIKFDEKCQEGESVYFAMSKSIYQLIQSLHMSKTYSLDSEQVRILITDSYIEESNSSSQTSSYVQNFPSFIRDPIGRQAAKLEQERPIAQIIKSLLIPKPDFKSDVFASGNIFQSKSVKKL